MAHTTVETAEGETAIGDKSENMKGRAQGEKNTNEGYRGGKTQVDDTHPTVESPSISLVCQ